MTARRARARAVTPALLRRIPLPALDHAGDKHTRGQVLVVGASVRVPGAILLSGVAALRAGAGKLQLATVEQVSVSLGLAVPESLVIALPATHDGEIDGARAGRLLREYLERADAVLIGPGMLNATSELLGEIVKHLGDDTMLVIDAAALEVLGSSPSAIAPAAGRTILTPHAGEMATILGVEKTHVDADPAAAAQGVAEATGAVVVLKGATSWIADADGMLLRYDAGRVGLATSGSGDTLAGIIVGLAARGAAPLTAAAWAVWAHGAAGNVLAKRTGAVGFLARELLAELPKLLSS